MANNLLKLLLAFLLLTTTVFAQTPTAYDANTDRVTRTNASITGNSADLTVGGRGMNYVFPDPAYGTRLLRVTTASSIPSAPNISLLSPGSAETRAWSSDSARFYVKGINGGVYFYDFDANTFQVSRPGNTANSSGGLNGVGVMDGEPYWSGINVNYLYGGFGFVVRRYDFSAITSGTDTPPFIQVIDVGAIYTIINGGSISGSLGRIQTSDTNPEVLMVPFGGIQDTWRYLLWYNLGTGAYKVLDTDGPTSKVRWYNSATSSWTDTAYADGWRMHNARMDMSGQYVLPTRTAVDVPAGESIIEVWDTVANTVVNIAATDHPGGHISTGFRYMVSFHDDNSPVDGVQWWIRAMNDLTNETRLAVPNLVGSGSAPAEFTADDHTSWHNARSGNLYPVLSATYRVFEPTVSEPWRPWDGELLALRTDGTSTVWRFMQHHSQTWSVAGRPGAFEDIPIPQMAPNGRYAFLSTNWGLQLGTDPITLRERTDVLLVELVPNERRRVTVSGKVVVSGKVG